MAIFPVLGKLTHMNCNIMFFEISHLFGHISGGNKSTIVKDMAWHLFLPQIYWSKRLDL